MADQPYTLENPEPREVEPEVVDETVDAQANPGAAYVATLDLNEGKVVVSETRVALDETVPADHPAAVIVPPEGRGEHPDLGLIGQPTPEQKLASGDAPEGTGVVDGEVVTGSESDKRAANES